MFKDEFIDFIDKSYTPGHYIAVAREKLASRGFTEVKEGFSGDIPNKFFVVRSERSIVVVNRKNFDCGVIVGSHIDSPVLRVSNSPSNFGVSHGCEYVRPFFYGGGLWMSWIDRDLSIAGRVAFKKDGKIISKLVHSEKAVAFIPSLAPHLKGSAGTKPGLSPSNFRPIVALKDYSSYSTFNQIIADLCQCEPFDIVDYDISFVPFQKAATIGFSDDLIQSARLDDLSCAIPAFQAMLELEEPATGTCVFVAYDNEEIGSRSRCGACSNFLPTVLKMAGADDDFLHRSILISADVSHAYNPNFENRYNPDQRLILGQGLLYGYSQQMDFATTAPITAFVKKIADELNVNIQPFINIHFTCTGSTIGPHINSKLGVRVIDLGVPLLAMHSIRELGSLSDIESMKKIVLAVYNHISDVLAFNDSINK